MIFDGWLDIDTDKLTNNILKDIDRVRLNNLNMDASTINL